MAKALKSNRPAASEVGPFLRAALSARFIGVAAVTLGAVTLFGGKSAAQILFASIFIIPGLLYLFLAAGVTRRRRWARIAEPDWPRGTWRDCISPQGPGS